MMSDTVAVPGARLHVERAGDGPAVQAVDDTTSTTTSR